MSAIIVSPTVQATNVAVSSETLALAQGLAKSIPDSIADVATFERGNDLFREIHEFDKALEANRVEVKAPFLSVCRQIDETCKKVFDVIAEAKNRLGRSIRSFQEIENARRDALRREAEAKALAEERERVAFAEAEANALRKAAGTAPTDVMEALPIVRPVAPAWTPPPMKSAIQSSKPKKRVEVFDEALVPFAINGIRLWKETDNRAIETLLKAGIECPGARLIDDDRIAAKAGR